MGTSSDSQSSAPTSESGSCLAASYPLYQAYEQAVQDPENEVRFVSKTFRALRGREAIALREDFCGSAAFSAQWVSSQSDRCAYGVDLDPEPLAYAREQYIAPLPRATAERLSLVQADVLEHEGAPVDVAVAYNFSYWVFKTRAEMLRYFKQVRACLVEDGLFFLDIMGGAEAGLEDETVTHHEDFIYYWRHESFNALTHELQCSIGFDFPDGSCLPRAFTYDWRLWSIPELRELLLEAGFSDLRVYWEEEDDEGEGTGVFSEIEHADNEGVWWAYLVAEA